MQDTMRLKCKYNFHSPNNVQININITKTNTHVRSVGRQKEWWVPGVRVGEK